MFVRGANGRRENRSDLGIKEVTFYLHEDFDPPEVVVTKPPFEVTKDGCYDDSFKSTQTPPPFRSPTLCAETQEEWTDIWNS